MCSPLVIPCTLKKPELRDEEVHEDEKITPQKAPMPRLGRRQGSHCNCFAGRHHSASTHWIFWPVRILHPPRAHGLALYWRRHYRRCHCPRLAPLRSWQAEKGKPIRVKNV